MFCKNCGKEIDNNAVFCSYCGTSTADKKVAKKKRRPILGIILFVLGVLIISAAFGVENEPTKVDSNPEKTVSTTEQGEQTFSVGDSVELNNIVVTLVDVSENNGTSYLEPSDGKVYVLCEFNIENNSSNDIAVSSIMCFEAYFDDYTTQLNLSAMLSTDKTQLDGTIASGKKMNGVVGYEVDKNWTEMEIRFSPDFWVSNDIIFTASK